MNTEYVSMKVDHDHINRHKKIFTRWINLQLAKAKPPVEVSDVIGELRDGQILLTLVELLLGIQVTRSEPASKRINKIRNVQEAMLHLLKNNVKTTGIIASEITAGDENAILGLLWSIIYRFQVMEALQQSPMGYDGDMKLIAWSQECIKGNNQKVSIVNLTSSWNDGVAFNILLHSFNRSLFNLDAILSSDVKTRLSHAFNLATATYDVPSLFDPEDVGLDTPDKNIITLFLSYLYQRMVKGSTVTIVKKEITGPTETTKEYEFKTITTRHETSSSGGTTINFQTITTTQEENHDDVFHDIKTIKEGGQGKVLIVDGFPQKVQIEQRRTLVVSPFRKPSGSSSRTSSGESSPIPQDSDSKVLEEEALMSLPPSQISREFEGNYAYTVIQTKRKKLVKNSGERVTSTTTKKTLQSSMDESYNAMTNKAKATNGDKENHSVLVSAKRDETDAKLTERNVGDTVITDNWKINGKESQAPLTKRESYGQDDKDTKNAVLTTEETISVNKKIEGKDKDKEQAHNGKGRDEKDKTEEKCKEKEQTPANNTSTVDVLLISAERIHSVTPPKTEPVEHSITEEDGYSTSDGSPARYYKYNIDKSTSPSSTYFVDYFKKKLDAVDESLFDLESKSKHSDKDSMDLKTTKNALDQQKEVVLELGLVQSKAYVVLDEGRQLIKDKCFNLAHGEYFHDRMDATTRRVKILEDEINKEHQRLFDLYIILLKQHLERMNDWLVRAESRMALDDVIEPTDEGVQRQVFEHQNFVEELSNYSMVNMILDMDLEHPAIDETIRDWIKVLSERWALVWTWAEEWKEKLNQALLDWEKFVEEETALLSWLSSKERTMDVIAQTDITNEEQVKMHLNLLETLDREMGTQRIRLESLKNAGEKLIMDAEYHNSTAKGIRDQTEDFDRCWGEVTSSVKERKATLEDAQNKVKQMGNLMREVRAWLDETELFIKFARSQQDPQKEKEIQEKVEAKCEERERNQLKVDEVKRLENKLSRNIDDTSNYYLKRVTKPFNKRWDDASLALNRYRNEDYPFIKPDDCFLIKCLKKALVAN